MGGIKGMETPGGAGPGGTNGKVDRVLSYEVDLLKNTLASDLSRHHTGMLDAFRRIDTDGSGHISAAELRTLCKMHNLPQQYTDELIRRCDVDGNGAMSYEEFSRVFMREGQGEEMHGFDSYRGVSAHKDRQGNDMTRELELYATPSKVLANATHPPGTPGYLPEDQQIDVFHEKDESFNHQTTYGNDMRVWKVSLPNPRKVEPFVPNNGAFYGETTSQAAYTAKPLPKRTSPEKPEQSYEPSAKFQGESESRSAFVDHGAGRRTPILPPRTGSPYLPEVPRHEFHGETTNRQHFQGYRLNDARLALGVATRGGIFHVVIPGTAKLPAEATRVFTTVVDDQADALVQVYQGSRPVAAENLLLGQFDLRGLPSSGAGRLKIPVTFRVDRTGALFIEVTEPNGSVRGVTMHQVDESDPAVPEHLESARKLANKDRLNKDSILALNNARDKLTAAGKELLSIGGFAELERANRELSREFTNAVNRLRRRVDEDDGLDPGSLDMAVRELDRLRRRVHSEFYKRGG